MCNVIPICRYTKKTQLEHILLRPDTYIGSIEKSTQPMWVLDRETKLMVNRQCSFIPGLYKIFDEIIVNAADNKQRDPTMNRIEVTINEQENFIRVWNNGNGIPIAIHQEHNIYVPELIFGNLLTGSNFDDNEAKTTGGRNGYGAKLANIFSTKFIVETADSSRGLKYRQEFNDNMNKINPPVLSKTTGGADYTCITFYPDLARFKMDCLDEDIVALLSKRVYDIAGTNTAPGAKLSVYLNGSRIDAKNFESYMSIYQGIEAPIAFERISDRWEIGVGVSDGSFQQVSYVNSICTTKGGCHVNYIVDQITTRLAAFVKKKNKGEEVKGHQIKNHLSVFVNALIVNPAFDSQTKENLTTKATAFGSTCTISDKMMKAIEKSDIIDNILNWTKFKQTAELKKKSGSKRSKLTGIPKLDDANCAGTSKSNQCTLILTEGDSAKALAISGLGVVGRDYYGVFPLRGKLLNVREASHAQIMKNEEIQNISKILGLTFGKEYNEVSSLRYGHLMIMTDQDHDGSHIKGLLINFLHHFWPSLLKIEGFLQQFITPIVKCVKGKKEKTFFTIPQYETWRLENGDARGWKVKYYKGLGTSTAAEAKEYFSNLSTHEIDFEWDERANDVIDMAFAKKRVEDRKLWLLSMEAGTHIDYDVDRISYDSFVNKELILFSQADNERSISHFMDGLKPSQRKVLYACFKRNLKSEIKVAQLAGYISEHAAYHHGEVSLAQTIIGMAQNYVGSNNINLLSPCGQFGTRLMGGKDAASPRYVFTKLEAITRVIFHPHDDPILEYQQDDGQSIEPVHYVPIVPMALINGSDGIGTGWSSNIPTYNPREIIENLKRMLSGEDPLEMKPWYRGFTGDIAAKTGRDMGNFSVTGTIEQLDESTLRISELPAGKWTTDYKQYLESMLIGSAPAAAATAAGGDNAPTCAPFIKDFKENHTDTTVLFTVTVAAEKIAEICNEKGGLMKKFKLEGSVATSNMNMFDLNQQIRKFEGPAHVMKDFFQVRLQYYDMRKVNLSKKLTEEWEKLDNKMRFVLAVIKGDLIVANRKKQDLMIDLKKQGFKAFREAKAGEEEAAAGEDDSETDEDPHALDKGYDYLLSMKIWSLTMERVQELINQRNIKRAELDELLGTAAETLWLNDLAALELALDDFEAAVDDEKRQEVAARKKAIHNANNKSKGKSSSKSSSKKKKHGSDSEDDDEGVDSDFEEKPAKKAPVKKAAAPAPKPVVAAPASAAAPAKVQSTLIKFMTNTTTAPAAKKPTAVTAAAVQERREEDIRENMTLAERLAAARVGAVKPAAAVAAPPAPVAAAAKPKAAPKAAAPKSAAPRKKAAAKVMDLCSDAESEAADSEDDIFKDAEVFTATITATRAPRAVAQKKTTYAVDSDLEDSEEEGADDDEAEFDDEDSADDDSDAFEDSEDDAPKKSKAKSAASKPATKSAPKAAAKPAAAKKTAAVPPPLVVSRPMVIASPPAKIAPAAKGVKRSSKSAVDSLISIAREVYSPGVASPQVVKKARAAVAKAPKAPKAAAAPKAASSKAPAAKKAPAPKKASKKNAFDDEEEEFDEEVVPASRARSPKPVRARKTLKYVEESEEEEEDFIVDSDADEESDFSDDE